MIGKTIISKRNPNVKGKILEFCSEIIYMVNSVLICPYRIKLENGSTSLISEQNLNKIFTIED